MARSSRRPRAAAVAVALAMGLSRSASAQKTCLSGYVWREAFPGDYVCVTPQTRAQAAQDNAAAADRREPGGAYGPATCKAGYVWREAKAGDVVCVTPEVRAQAASDNAAAASRVVADRAPGGVQERPSASTRGKVLSTYRTSEWSPWIRAQGIEYRYRWGWDPANGLYAENVDAMFELKNSGTAEWRGAARSVNCTQNTLEGSASVTLQAKETKGVKFRTRNCGTLQNPSFQPNVVKSDRID